MQPWEQLISRPLRALRLESIRSKILVFAVLATLIPSLSTTWVAYRENTRSLTGKITQELQTVSTSTSRDLDLWLKERLYDLRVFSSSYEVSDNLARIPRTSGGPVRTSTAYRRATDYLNSVRVRFPEDEELVLLDPQGHPVVSSAGVPHPVELPANWATQLRSESHIVGDAVWDSALGKATMILAVPIPVTTGRSPGILVGRLNFTAIQEMLQSGTSSGAGQVYLVSEDGHVVISATESSPALMRTRLGEATRRNLFAREGEALQYNSVSGPAVVGALKRVPRVDWAILSELPATEAFRQVAHLRNVTATIVILLLAGVGLLGYFLGLLIVRPLGRLTAAAAEVAAGDFSVDVPVVGGGELGYLTEVFNNMVTHLRDGRQALAEINATLQKKNDDLGRLSVTDALTGLYNRRYLMETLANEARRSRRLKHTFTVLMSDVDHFKQFNDAHGHLKGDEALRCVAKVLKDCSRDVDCVARYGGEEFMIILPETPTKGAVEVAERIRERLAAEQVAGGRLTLSIGVAEFPANGEGEEALSAAADAALYQAKGAGRDRVVAAGRPKRRSSLVMRAAVEPPPESVPPPAPAPAPKGKKRG
ncbi:MAG TPA: diguanylate cyclase [Gemmatimonadales bacterium]